MKIVAAVVTYNRRELLGRCIDHLQRQTRVPDKIIIINNSSTDGTEDMLAARGVAFITQENVGSAGGWWRSIEYAKDGDYDAVWLMDDDGFPHEGSLAALELAMTSGVAGRRRIARDERDFGVRLGQGVLGRPRARPQNAHHFPEHISSLWIG
jgi:rhamnopyranosyl-N-acetylglucosaminyl-diphospho-decaprenol beta-1,3/1,4-galactofuranosyltransferase